MSISVRTLLCVCFSVILLSAPAASAQTTQSRIDSLVEVLPTVKEDTGKVRLLCNISREYFQVLPARGVDYGEQALALAEMLDYEYGRLMAHNAIGRCEAVGKNFARAMSSFNQALSIARKLNLKEDIAKQLLSIGNVYRSKGDDSSALKLFVEAKVAYDNAGIKNQQTLMNNIGSLHMGRQDYRLAISYMLEGIRMEKAENASPASLATLYGNIGGAYAGLKKHDSGLFYLNLALEHVEITGNKQSASNILNNIGQVYLALVKEGAQGMPDSLQHRERNFARGLEYEKRSLALAEEIGDLEQRCNVLHNIAKAYRLNGELEKALQYHDIYNNARDSFILFVADNAFAKADAEFRVQKTTDSLEFENQLKDQELKKRRSDRNTIIAIISMFGISGILLINRQKEKQVQKRKIAEAEKLRIEQLATQQLHDFTRNIHEKNDIIEAITAEVEKLRQNDNSTAMLLDETLLSELRQSILLTDDQWDMFKSTFEKVHTGYLSRLKTKLPDLTPAETRFIVLSKLNLSPREMAGMLGITSPAVRASKYRLMKKLGFESDAQLDQLISAV